MKALTQLAQDVLVVLGDADHDTACAALEIAQILLRHRKEAEIEFVNGFDDLGWPIPFPDDDISGVKHFRETLARLK